MPGLALNFDLPDFCILSNEDYRREPQAPGSLLSFEFSFVHEAVFLELRI
jgi:hypothetical protein